MTIINDILDFSRVEAGKLLIDRRSFNLWHLVGDTLKALAPRAHDKGLELICDMAPDTPVFVLGDPGRLRQILVNLIGNAIKFTDRGQVILRIEPEAGGVADDEVVLLCAVIDSGIGIARDKLETIFDAFAQEDSSITRKYGGTGLGLTISQRLAAALGGRLWVESEPGRGSTFQFTTRLGLDAGHAAVGLQVPSLAGARILIVDDNPESSHVLLRTVRDAGAIADADQSGELAMARLACLLQRGVCAAYDLILINARLPGLDGFSTAEKILALPHCSGVRIVMLSSSGVRGDAERCRKIGFAGYLTKPVLHDELFQLLARVLQRPMSTGSPTLVTRHVLRDEQTPQDILLVEDHPVNRKLAEELLTRWGHRVSVAGNGWEAVEMIGASTAGKRFDLVLMDMQMPVMDGLAATRQIRADERAKQLPRLPIIAMTANVLAADRERCLQAGMDDYIGKPIKTHELQRVLWQFGTAGIEPFDAAGGEDAADSRDALSAGLFDYAAAVDAADHEMVEIIVHQFLDQYRGDLAKIEAALLADDLKSAGMLAHSLRSTLALFGAEPAVQLAMRIERQVPTGNVAGVDTVLAHLKDETDRLAAALKPLADALPRPQNVSF